jgi:hypothetical protein
MTYLLRKGNHIYHNSFPPDGVLWAGQFSVARIQGSIVQFIDAYLASKNTLVLYHQSDGDIRSDQVHRILHDHHLSEKVIVVTLSQKTEDALHYLYAPLDDQFFSHGTASVFTDLPSWESRSSVAFWRGGCSGGGLESIRCRTVAALIDQPLADVKLSTWWSEGKHIPEHFFAERVHPAVFLHYKIFFIIDGNCIASNHMWGFATGCVPFLISNATYWFLSFATPFVHYIPIHYDLSNLLEQLDWVRTHDAEAKKIAENALQFSKDHFNPEFQHRYLMHEIDRITADSNNT